MPDDINDLDVTDAGLKGIFGNRFHDETQSEPVRASSKKVTANTTNVRKAAEKPVKEPNWMDGLKDSVKWVGIFGGLSWLVFYWQQAGLMAESIAVPCMCVCTALAGWGVGKNAVRGTR